MIEIVQINNKGEWESFLLQQNHTPFLQSWNSGEHYKLDKSKIFRIGLRENGILKGISLLIKVIAKRGTYLYCPYGPILENWTEDSFSKLIQYITKLGESEKCSFIKMSPYIEDNKENKKLFEKYQFKKSQIHILSETSWILDLSDSEEVLMANMRKTTRNLIRRALKEGVIIEKSQNPEDLESFFKLYEETGIRHKFTLYNRDFISNQVRIYGQDDQAMIFNARYNDEIIASAVIMFYGKEGAYHHGASTHKYPKIPGSYLLQWEAIKEAKKRGHQYYNFWGIYEGSNPKHPFKGITTFKTGFGGSHRHLLPCYDLPITKIYWLNYLVEKYRRIKRGF